DGVPVLAPADDCVLDVAPADVLPVAELLVPPEAEVLELGVPVVAPADVLPELLLPLCAHAAHRNAAATAALTAFRSICKPPLVEATSPREANRVPGLGITR